MEQILGKPDPVLIVQTDLLNHVHPSTVICPLTTNISTAELLRVNLIDNTFGLEKKSAIMIDQLRAIDKKRLIKKLGKISPSYQTIVKKNLRIIMEL